MLYNWLPSLLVQNAIFVGSVCTVLRAIAIKLGIPSISSLFPVAKKEAELM